MGCFLHCLLMGLLFVPLEGSVQNSLNDLVDNIFTSYDSRIQPLEIGSKSVNIEIGYNIELLHSFDDLKGELTYLGTMNVMWNDSRLSWTPTDYGNTSSLVLPKIDVWHPSFDISSSLETLKLPGLRANKVYVHDSGLISYISTDLLTVICSADVTNYPYDTQSCKTVIRPNGYKAGSDVVLRYVGQSSTTVEMENAEWKVTSLYITLDEDNNLEVIMNVERRKMFALLTLTMPLYIICAVNPVVFLLPAESGERISFSVTIFLSFTVYISILSDHIPAGSDPIARLVSEVFCMMVYSVLILLATIASLRQHHSNDKKSVSRWSPCLTFAARCQCCCRKFRGISPDKTISASDIHGVNASKNKDGETISTVTEVTSQTGISQHDVSRAFDICMLVLFYGGFVVLMLVYHI